MMPSMRQCELADPYILQLRVKLFIEFKKSTIFGQNQPVLIPFTFKQHDWIFTKTLLWTQIVEALHFKICDLMKGV